MIGFDREFLLNNNRIECNRKVELTMYVKYRVETLKRVATHDTLAWPFHELGLGVKVRVRVKARARVRVRARARVRARVRD